MDNTQLNGLIYNIYKVQAFSLYFLRISIYTCRCDHRDTKDHSISIHKVAIFQTDNVLEPQSHKLSQTEFIIKLLVELIAKLQAKIIKALETHRHFIPYSIDGSKLYIVS